MNHYENTILRPAVLTALATEPEVIVHVAPVEKLTAVRGRTQSSAELGKGTPDLLLSVRWRRRGCATCGGGGRLVQHMTMTLGQARKVTAASIEQDPSVKWAPCYDCTGAAWVVQELKAPPCPSPDGAFLCLACCGACTDVGRTQRSIRSSCCGKPARMVPRWTEGRIWPVQRELHAAWERGGRWVFVPRTPAEARAAIEEARRRLRAAGLEPVAVEGRPC